MTKFNLTPGQRVRYIGTYTPRLIGQLGTVRYQPSTDTNVPVKWDNGDKCPGVFPINLELVVDAPKKARKSKPKAENTKIAKLRAHFLSGKSLTQLEAIGLYGAFRLAARVHDLKADGMKIVTRMKEDPNGNPYAEYQLRSPWVKA